MPHTLMNSSYRLNTTDFQFTQYHPHTLKSFHLRPTWWVPWCGPFSCFAMKRSPYNFTIHFPTCTKFITHEYDVALHTSMHQYCVKSIAPRIEHRNSDNHPIYMAFIGFFPPYHTLQDDMQLKGEHTLRQHLCQSINKTQLTTNLFEGFFTCSRVLLTSAYII